MHRAKLFGVFVGKTDASDVYKLIIALDTLPTYTDRKIAMTRQLRTLTLIAFISSATMPASSSKFKTFTSFTTRRESKKIPSVQ